MCPSIKERLNQHVLIPPTKESKGAGTDSLSVQNDVRIFIKSITAMIAKKYLKIPPFCRPCHITMIVIIYIVESG